MGKNNGPCFWGYSLIGKALPLQGRVLRVQVPLVPLKFNILTGSKSIWLDGWLRTPEGVGSIPIFPIKGFGTARSGRLICNQEFIRWVRIPQGP